MDSARNRVRIDLEAITKNVQTVREAVGPSVLIMAVVKKNAYGHGLVRTSLKLLEAGADRLGVADVGEAAELREAGVGCPIHILGPPLAEEMRVCVENDIVVTIADLETATIADSEAAKAGKKLKCHIVVDTGMGRLGPLPGDSVQLAVTIESMKHIELEGAFTHFSTCDDGDRSSAQLKVFLDTAEKIRREGVELPVLHAAGCGAIFRMPKSLLDMVRPGLCLYGMYGDCGMRGIVSLHPAMVVSAQITFVKTVPEGTPISYGGTYVVKKPTTVATIPIGYGNGYNFRLSNRGWVAVIGRRAPVIGRVTMDYIMVDVTDIAGVEAGMEAFIMGSPGPSAEELAALASTVPHEIVCGFGS